jgi:predicted  nucleic acid-binding Zn-ribbon protein
MERTVLRGLAVGAAAVFSLSACASAGGAKKEATAPKIEESWLARVPPENMAPVEQARTERQTQRDELNRAGVARKDAENQVSVAQNEEKAAKAQVDAAEAQLKGAKSRGQYTAINEAKTALDRAKLAHQVAQANVQRREKAVDVAKAQEDLEKARVETADTRVSQAEYRALQSSGDTRASRIDPARYDAALAASQARENEAQAKVQQRQNQYEAANTKYQQLGRELQASQPAPPAG